MNDWVVGKALKQAPRPDATTPGRGRTGRKRHVHTTMTKAKGGHDGGTKWNHNRNTRAMGEAMSESRIHMDGLKSGDVALLRDVAEQAAEKAVTMTFIRMGLNPDEPIKAQGDFKFLRDMAKRVNNPEFEADLNWLRRTRKRGEGLFGKVIATSLGLAVVGALHAIWAGLQSLVGRP